MTKASKILISLIVVLMLLSATTAVMATGITITPPTNNGVKNLGQKVLGYIQVIGNVVAVGTILVLAIKYMMGSTAEKAEYKKTFIPYLVGAILLFGATNVVGLFKTLGEEATSTLTGSVTTSVIEKA